MPFSYSFRQIIKIISRIFLQFANHNLRINGLSLSLSLLRVRYPSVGRMQLVAHVGTIIVNAIMEGPRRDVLSPVPGS